jgi:putative oxidoreductase
MRTASQIARYLLGLIFLVFGLNWFFHFLHLPGPAGVAAQFFGAIFVSHFHVVIFLLQIVPAVFLLIRAGLPLAIVVTVLWLLVAYSVRSAFSGIFQRLVLATKDEAALFAQYDVIGTWEVETKSANGRITEKAKATKMLEDDPGSSSAQMRDSR